MSAPELALFDNLSIRQQIIYLGNAQGARDRAIAQFGGYPPSLVNGAGDAYRHACFLAFNVVDLGPSLSLALSNAHEDYPGNDPLEKEMDLRNNAQGIIIGMNAINSNTVNPEAISQAVLDAVFHHQLWMIDAYGNLAPSVL